MLDEEIIYQDGLPVMYEVFGIERYPRHRHFDTLEILFASRGTVDVLVSCDRFTITEGNFLIINPRDFHSIKSNDAENIIVLFYININHFEKYFPFIKATIFACQSAAAKDNKGYEVQLINKLLAKIVFEIANKQEEYPQKVDELVHKLVTILFNHFNVINYYNRNIKISPVKLAHYYIIQKYLYEGFMTRTVLDDISKNEFFCKSYLSHLFKEITTFSVNEIISWLRVWSSEELLINSDMDVRAISEACGFSDPKYYYKHFKKWFGCTPKEFRLECNRIKDAGSSYCKLDSKLGLDSFADCFVSPDGDQLFAEENPPVINRTKLQPKGNRALAKSGLAQESSKERKLYNSNLPVADATLVGKVLLLLDISPQDGFERSVEMIDTLRKQGVVPRIAFQGDGCQTTERERFINRLTGIYGQEEVAKWEFWAKVTV